MARNFTRLWIVVAVVLAGGVGIGYWRQSIVAKRVALATATIANGLATADFVAARSALSSLADPARRATMERDIRVAELKHALASRDSGLLRLAIGADGESWMESRLLEAADLALAREAVQARDFSSYGQSAGKWQHKGSLTGQWTLLEADQLLARKMPEEALKLLQAARLSGPEEAQRHARLALLAAKEPWRAMNSLDEGLKADPMSPDLLVFRAQIEEAAGRTTDARLDYVAAVLAERKNPLYRDALANFYLRRGDLPAAAETWRDAAQDTGLGVYALKSWFWSRVCGVRLTKPLPPCCQQGWLELIAALAATSNAVFWNASLDDLSASTRGCQQRPEVVWLRLLESIRTHDLPSARKQLESGFPQEAEQLWPGLSLRLLVHLFALEGQDPRLPLAGRELPPVPADAHPFLIEFGRWAKRADTAEANARMESWLARPTAISGTLLASGWAGAALITGNARQLVPDADAPEWFDYGYAKALVQQEGKETGRIWLESLAKRTGAADLLLAELRLAANSVDQGLALLQQIAAGDSRYASRASWTLALAELDRGNAAKARQITLASPDLAASVPGKEILARIALAEGTRAETLRIYQELGGSSADAMIYLAKESFAARDFKQARMWTAKLARQFPEQPEFRNNLLKIDEAEKSPKP